MTAATTNTSERTLTGVLWLVLLLVAGFGLATDLSLWFQSWQGNRAGSANFLEVAMGDARRMFAYHFFVKADAYFHSGYYPTIYDTQTSVQTPHIASDAAVGAGKKEGEDELSFLGPPRNWIDAFSRQFFPARHTELNSGGANGKERIDKVREIMPWLKLSTELDPRQPRTYAVAAYWLRQMGAVDEAETFLREGLRQNPGDPGLLLELGRICFESRHDPARARNVWEAALRKLASLPPKENEANRSMEGQTLDCLVELELQANNRNRALQLLNRLKEISPQPEFIEQWIARVKAGGK